MLKVRNVTKSYGTELVLDRISFVINQGERVGLVGQNGVGKSTLLRIIAGVEESDSGEVYLQRGASLVYMPQSGTKNKTPNLFGGVNHKWDVRKLLADLRLDHLNLDEDSASWSGGELSKLNLVKALSERPDLYLLDEPTNNLDFPALSFLEQTILKNSRSSFLIVSHDREFLDRIVERVFEIDEFSHSLKEYTGNYSYYEREKGLNREIEYRRWEEQQKEIKRLGKSLEEKRRWVKKATKGPKVKDHNKLGRGFAKDRSKVLGGATKAIETRLKKFKILQKPETHQDLHFSVSSLERSGDIVLRAAKITKSLGNFHLGPLSFELQNGERVAILGLNGAGKTTLINLLIGNVVPDSGEIKQGAKINVGFLEQIPTSSGEVILSKFIRSTGLPETNIRRLLHRFGLGSNDIKKQFGTLSPGEQMRLEIAGFVVRRVNLLVLDEPTNNLDLEAIGELEKALCEFNGTLLVVTHDRRFLKNVRINKFYSLENGVLKEFVSLEDYEKTFSLQSQHS